MSTTTPLLPHEDSFLRKQEFKQLLVQLRGINDWKGKVFTHYPHFKTPKSKQYINNVLNEKSTPSVSLIEASKFVIEKYYILAPINT
jgi:hypothetical protein